MSLRTHSLSMLAIGLLLTIVLTACGGGSDPEDTPQPAPGPSTASPPAASPEETNLAVSTSSTGCPEEADEHGFQDYDQFGQTLQCVAELFSWPADRYPDLASARSGFNDPENAHYQAGLSYTVMSSQNRCAWYSEWLDAQQGGNTDAATDALGVITDVIPHFDSVIPGMPPDVVPVAAADQDTERADRAALGDPSLVQQYVSVNCTGLVWTGQS